ncbi:MAG: transposase [Syntrophobacterales bacterium]|nr:transposase [Syntrophobacterales bacterium]
MARLPRIVVPQYPHHIVQRGNRRMDVFFTDEDRLRYLDYLEAACRKYGVEINKSVAVPDYRAIMINIS